MLRFSLEFSVQLYTSQVIGRTACENFLKLRMRSYLTHPLSVNNGPKKDIVLLANFHIMLKCE